MPPHDEERFPWFPFFATDWLADGEVTMLSLEAEGAFIRLLAHQWIEGSIPADPDALRRLLKGIDEASFQAIWKDLKPRFSSAIASPSKLTNLRLEKERRNALAQHKERQRAGRLGAVKRWGKKPSGRKRSYSSANSPAIAEPMANRWQTQTQTQAQSQTQEGKQTPDSSPPHGFPDQNENRGDDLLAGIKPPSDEAVVPRKRSVRWTAQLQLERQAVLDAWAETDLPQIQALTSKRNQALLARLRDAFWREHWRAGLKQLAASRFAHGEGDRGWVANFDWFLRPDSLARILEGRYDERQGAPPKPKTPEEEEADRIYREMARKRREALDQEVAQA